MPPDGVRKGRRVVCELNGPFQGQNGRVIDTWGDYAHVKLRNCSIIEPKRAFRPL
jgi:hypothetical protein